MSNVQDALAKCKEVDGFVGIGAFSPQGELFGQVSNAGTELAELGALANDVLLKAQKSTDVMGVGRGNQVHIEAPKAHILVRCLNENTDFAASEPGRAHVHCVLVLEKEGNIALGKMKLESAIQELAPLCR
jgi:predicted regulator of Ras-like GTPase activity (Roadblock/LC7/MglB family)